jgi:hypothetical protein
MKTSSLSAMRSAAFGLAMAVGISAQGALNNGAATQPATTAPAGKTAPAAKAETGGKKKRAAAAIAATSPSTGSANAVGLLDEAYGLLRRADHDYKGHRARAMHQIEDAAKELGTKLSGGGKDDEAQKTSDSQLHNAESLLQQAVGGLTGKAHHHVEEALKQLGIALNIK